MVTNLLQVPMRFDSLTRIEMYRRSLPPGGRRGVTAAPSSVCGSARVSGLTISRVPKDLHGDSTCLSVYLSV